MGELSPFQKKLAERLAAKEAAKQPELPNTLADLDKTDKAEPSAVDIEIERVINSISFEDAYRKWCGKMEPGAAGARTEGIKISCPIPGHADNDPSAWYNTENGLWYCGACQEGGDIYDIAAWHFGYDVPGYKGADFPKLRRQMAEDFGLRLRQATGGEYVPIPPESSIEPEKIAPPAVLPVAATGNTASDLAEPPLLNLVEFPLPTELQPLPIDWRSILPAETFLEQWMVATSIDDLPEEYYFWLGLMAIGLAAGDQAILADDPPIKGNLFICLYGPSGIGKTRASSRLVRLLQEAMPYDAEDPDSTGTYQVPMPGSAEALIDSFSKPILDPNDPKKVMGYASVRGMVRFDELSALMSRSNRVGSAIKPHLMEMFDGYNVIDIASRGAGRARAERHFATVIASTQPGAIRDVLVQTDADSGFINRWVFASGPLKPLRSYRSVQIDISSLVAPLNALRQWTSARFRNIKLEGVALDAWEAFFRSTIEPVKIANEKPLLTRCDLLLKKLILLFCINEKLDAPTVELVERVLTLYPYIERSYAMLVSEIGVGPQQECREKILTAVGALQSKTGKAVTARQIVQRLGKKFAPDMVVRTLSAMVNLGDIEQEVRQGVRGPGTLVYKTCA